MATAYFRTLFSLAFIVHFTITTVTTPITITSPASLAVKLIHSDSVLSPHNSKATIADHFTSMTKRSIARLTYLWNKMKQASDDNDYLSNLVPFHSYGVFLMNFSIGEPPVYQLAVMDTGSSFTWVKCLPCTPCSQQTIPIFDPSRSSTYASLKCSDCSNCDENGQCPYNVQYVGNHPSEGIYASEQLTFETSDESIVKEPSVIFGCGHKNSNNYRQINGVFGLGSGRFSLLPKFGKKFSYCTGGVRDTTYKFNQLILGDRANMQGDSTPLSIINGLYYISLEGISIGGRKLDIDPSIFQRTTEINSGVLIDCGADHTWLAKNGFEVLSVEVESLLRGVVTKTMGNRWTLCYGGVASRDLSGFPVVTFHFAQGAVLDLDIGSMFVQSSENEFCMALLPGNYLGDDYESFSSIGMMAQQNYNVGYDLSGMRLYFQRIDCELLNG